MKKITCIVLLVLFYTKMFAQSGTNSPYSQFGLGVLADQTSGFNKGMNGLGLGFHERNQVNYTNPASYANIDSLTFIFDMGLSLKVTNFSENGKRLNANNSSIEYIVAGFRLKKRLGLSFGFVPFTNIGYNYSSTGAITNNGETVTYTNTYNGEGGIHQVYLGLGYSPIKDLSIGVNFSYLWGDYTKYLTNRYSDNTIKAGTQLFTANIRNYKIDFGVQYTKRLSKKNALTLGVTFTPGHKISDDANLATYYTNNTTSVVDTTNYDSRSLRIPNIYGIGLMWNYDDKLKVGADYTLQRWGSLQYPQYVSNTTNDVSTYTMQDGLLSNRHKATFGLDYLPNMIGRSFFSRIHYRAGISYTTPYIKVNGNNGPKELGASIGFGIPIINYHNSRSLLNISAGWIRSHAKGFITENQFQINIGLTFNQDWFAKWKMD